MADVLHLLAFVGFGVAIVVGGLLALLFVSWVLVSVVEFLMRLVTRRRTVVPPIDPTALHGRERAGSPKATASGIPAPTSPPPPGGASRSTPS